MKVVGAGVLVLAVMFATPRIADACICVGTPTVLPADGATGVPLNAQIQILGSSELTLGLTDGTTSLPITVEEKQANRWYTVVPSSALQPNTTYTIQVDAARSTFTTGSATDTSSEPFAGLAALSPQTMEYPISGCSSSCVTASGGRISRYGFTLAPVPTDAAILVFEFDTATPGTFAIAADHVDLDDQIAAQTCAPASFRLTPGQPACGRVTAIDYAGNVSDSAQLCSETLACAPKASDADGCNPSPDCDPGCSVGSPSLLIGLATLALRRRRKLGA